MSQALQCDQNKVIKSDNYNTLYKAIYDKAQYKAAYDGGILIAAQKALPILPQIPDKELCNLAKKYNCEPVEYISTLRSQKEICNFIQYHTSNLTQNDIDCILFYIIAAEGRSRLSYEACVFYMTFYMTIPPNEIIMDLQKQILEIKKQSIYPARLNSDISEHLKINNKYKNLPFEQIVPSVPIAHAPVMVTVATCSNNYNIKYFWINICFLVIFISYYIIINFLFS